MTSGIVKIYKISQWIIRSQAPKFKIFKYGEGSETIMDRRKLKV